MRKKYLFIALLLFTLLAAKVTCNASSAFEMLQTTDFKSGVSLPWMISESNELNSWSEVKNGEFLVHIDRNGEAKWDVQLRHKEISISAGREYTVYFKLYAQKPQKIYARIGDAGEPYAEAWSNNWTPFNIPEGGEMLEVRQTFVSKYDCPSAEFAFYFGGPDPYGSSGDCSAPVPQVIHFVEMSLQSEEVCTRIPPKPTPERDIRVNQLGYYSGAQKHATLVSDDALPFDVQLKDSTGNVVWNGKSQPKGEKDIASGENVHLIDFSDFKTAGKDYRLFAGTASSFPFDIGIDLYNQMKYDALKYFYHARSGIEIKMPYCEDIKWQRSAGHPDDSVKQFPNKTYVDDNGNVVSYIGPSTIDGSGGWYDAGDYGKYVVNGGLATWTLQNQYELAKKNRNTDAYDDGTLNIPESEDGKKTPDLLDEARWNVEYFLKVQITSGSTPGMVIHKLADERWTVLGVKPGDDDQKRYYYPVSTAATLNFAAVTAQASRLWEEYDEEFATQCLKQSETAWKAALEHPKIYSPFNNIMGTSDINLDDEFYWAACELFITTGKPEYLDYLKESKYALKCPTTLSGESNGTPGSMDWSNTAACGTIDLILCRPDGLTAVDLDAAARSMEAAADIYLSVQANEGYEVPFEVSTYINEFGGQSEVINDGYPWASNQFVVNNGMILACAYEFTGDRKYLNGVIETMNYIMGRNPINKCYVSGYGENPLQYPHHRYYCPQIDPALPSVPPGFLSAGPNSGCQDPWAAGSGFKANKVAAQKCYVDHVESWSTNEVTMNLNAAFAWLAGYIDERANRWDPCPTTTYIVTATPSEEPLSPDIDRNGYVNIADVMLVATSFNTTTGDAKYVKRYDLDQNGAINISDIMIILVYFNEAINR